MTDTIKPVEKAGAMSMEKSSKKKRRGSMEVVERKRQKVGDDAAEKRVRIEENAIEDHADNDSEKKKKKKKKSKSKKSKSSDDNGSEKENVADKTAAPETPQGRPRSATHSVLKSPGSTSPVAHRRHKSVSFSPDTKTEDGDSIRQLKAGLLSEPGQTHPKKQHPPNEHKREKKKARKAKSLEKKDAQFEGYEVHPGLVYIKAYLNDRENWKFRKQKQNWVLRNWMDVSAVPDGAEGYDAALAEYIKGLQSEGARDRVLKEGKEIIESKGGEGELKARKLARAKVILKALGHEVDDDEEAEEEDKSSSKLAEEKKSERKEVKKDSKKDDSDKDAGSSSSESSSSSSSEGESTTDESD